jgi:DNA polymerase-4
VKLSYPAVSLPSVGRSQAIGRGRDPRFGPEADDAGCTVLHVDMDAFFASVEVRRRPELTGRPVVVGGVGPRGVVSSASYEARRYGVRSAMPGMRARALCPQAVFLPPDFTEYSAASDAVMRIFRDVTPLVEPLSLDEAFLDVAGAQRLLGRPAVIAQAIRDRVSAEQQLTCSVGVAPSKFVAKLGSTRAKPDGMIVVPAGQVLDFLHPLPVDALWGVGERAAETLHRLGLATVGDLARAPVGMLRGALGDASAVHLHELSWGRDPRRVTSEREDKSIGAEMTFDTDVSDPELIRRSLLALADKVGARLRAAGHVGRTIAIKVRFADFRTINRSRTMRTTTDVAREIFETSWALFDAVRAGSSSIGQIRLIGVRVEGLAAAATASRQLTLGEPERGWREAEAAADAVAARFGRSIVGPASLLGRTDLRRTENHPHSTVVPLSDPPTPS